MVRVTVRVTQLGQFQALPRAGMTLVVASFFVEKGFFQC
jgi:hypothetical protein